jgi:hypothetical protein
MFAEVLVTASMAYAWRTLIYHKWEPTFHMGQSVTGFRMRIRACIGGNKRAFESLSHGGKASTPELSA